MSKLKNKSGFVVGDVFRIGKRGYFKVIKISNSSAFGGSRSVLHGIHILSNQGKVIRNKREFTFWAIKAQKITKEVIEFEIRQEVDRLEKISKVLFEKTIESNEGGSSPEPMFLSEMNPPSSLMKDV